MTADIQSLSQAPEYRETRLVGADQIEFGVGDAGQVAPFHLSAIVFDVVACSGPEAGARSRARYVARHGDGHPVMTAPPSVDGEVADQVRLHGDGAGASAFQVEDAGSARQEAGQAGRRPLAGPQMVDDARGAEHRAAAKKLGDAVHACWGRSEYAGARLSGRREEFLAAPKARCDILGGRVEVIDEELEQLRQINLLVDRDEQGDVMQTFISSVEARLTLYFEVIQRKGSSDFGKGNFRALFRPIEQGVRGNL